MGDGPEKPRLTQLVTDLGIKNQVTFTGFISTNEKFSILAACDFFVFSRAWNWDGFGMTTIEAMSVGTPVITSKFGPQMEIITHGLDGLHFKAKDAGNLAKKIVEMAESKTKRTLFGKKGLITAQKYFSYDVMEKTLLGALKKLSID